MSGPGGAPEPGGPPAPEPGGGAPSRGRVVMLVGNGVRNDSRVQKEARSAAERGWDVVLIGRSPSRQVESFPLGAAEVRRLPGEGVLLGRRYELRTGLRRASIGYPSERVARFRARQLRVRRAEARSKPARAVLRLTAAWVRRRARATTRRARGPSRMSTPAGQLWTQLLMCVRGRRVWRLFTPHLWDFEVAYGDAVDRLAPDIVHANDVDMLGVGARAVARARERGRHARLVYDAHEWVPGLNAAERHPWWLPGQVAHEREYIGAADAVVTVSEPLAGMLQEAHRLARRPAVVLNAPPVPARPPAAAEKPGGRAGSAAGDFPEPARASEGADTPVTLRTACGLDAATPLIVYAGSVTAQRGVVTMIDALPGLPGVHVALVVSSPQHKAVRELVARAKELGVADRLHLAGYVAPEQVIGFLASADAGVHPTLHWPNHEISLASKFFEYSHARLPIVVSDVRTMAAMVRRTGQGEVFVAGDVDDYARAVGAVLADPGRYRAAYDGPVPLDAWTWPAQAETLDGVYAGLLARG